MINRSLVVAGKFLKLLKALLKFFIVCNNFSPFQVHFAHAVTDSAAENLQP